VEEGDLTMKTQHAAWTLAILLSASIAQAQASRYETLAKMPFTSGNLSKEDAATVRAHLLFWE
jgi:hypothetical protein